MDVYELFNLNSWVCIHKLKTTFKLMTLNSSKEAPLIIDFFAIKRVIPFD